MAKRAPETSKPQDAAPTDSHEVDLLLIDVASALLADYFFNPDNEASYKRRYPARSAPPGKEPGALRGDPPIAEEAVDAGRKPVRWRLEAMSNRNGLRLTMTHQSFSAAIEGIWQFQRETLRGARVIQRTGSVKSILKTTGAMLDSLQGPGPTAEELEDLLAALSDATTAGPLLNERAEEPPPADLDDRLRLKDIVDQVTRRSKSDASPEDRAW